MIHDMRAEFSFEDNKIRVRFNVKAMKTKTFALSDLHQANQYCENLKNKLAKVFNDVEVDEWQRVDLKKQSTSEQKATLSKETENS